MSFIKFLTNKNPQMENMVGPAVKKLEGRPPEQICHLSGARYLEKDGFMELESLGKKIRFSIPEFESECLNKAGKTCEIEPWHYLTLLQYLCIADGTAPAGRFVSLRELPEGGTRGMGFDKEIDQIFETRFSRYTKEQFAKACRAAGAEIVSGKADVCAEFRFAPYFPVRIHFWEADEEFPASAKVLTDANAVHYLSLEGCGTACLLTVSVIEKVQ